MNRPSLRDYFTFSRKERNSIILLLFLIVLTSLSFEIYQYLGFNRTSIILPPITTEMLDRLDSTEVVSTDPFFREKYLTDINKASASDFLKLEGIGPVLSERIVKYRQSINGFKTIDDVSKVYGLSHESFKNIKSFLTISEKQNASSEVFVKKTEIKSQNKIKAQIEVDINKADSSTLTTLKGIGPKLSQRIVKYREMIGGFDSLRGLKKVYGITEDLFLELGSSIIISNKDSIGDFVKEENKDSVHFPELDLDLNTATASELEQIKGIGPFYSNAIIELRSNLGGYARMDQLKSLYNLELSTYDEITRNVSIKTPHQTFDINELKFRELLRMEILDYKEVQYVFNLKRSLGDISSADQIKNLQGIPKDKLDLLLTYLTFNQESN